MKPLLALFLLACGPDTSGWPTGRYAVAVEPPLVVDEADHGIEILAGRIQRADLMLGSWVITDVQKKRLTVHHEPEPYVSGGELVAGSFAWPNAITIVWTPDRCLARTAFLHEVMHSILCGVDVLCDKDHALTHWWAAEAHATRDWMVEAQACLGPVRDVPSHACHVTP